MGLEETRRKLIEQDIPERLLHADWACPMHPRRDKRLDISLWLRKHRPSRQSAIHRGSLRFVVLDDDVIDGFGGHQIWTTMDDGLTVDAYRAACGYLGGADKPMGVHEVASADEDRVVAAFDGDRMAAARWLHACGGHVSPAALLCQGERQREAVWVWLDQDVASGVPLPLSDNEF